MLKAKGVTSLYQDWEPQLGLQAIWWHKQAKWADSLVILELQVSYLSIRYSRQITNIRQQEERTDSLTASQKQNQGQQEWHLTTIRSNNHSSMAFLSKTTTNTELSELVRILKRSKQIRQHKPEDNEISYISLESMQTEIQWHANKSTNRKEKDKSNYQANGSKVIWQLRPLTRIQKKINLSFNQVKLWRPKWIQDNLRIVNNRVLQPVVQYVGHRGGKAAYI